jgi:hypothetical protein|eukprot:COSAG02_NODE_322_length_24779_cov_14.118233_13_plen_71_part_00
MVYPQPVTITDACTNHCYRTFVPQIKLSLMMPTLRLETIDEITKDQKRQKAEKRAAIFGAMQGAAAGKDS